MMLIIPVEAINMPGGLLGAQQRLADRRILGIVGRVMQMIDDRPVPNGLFFYSICLQPPFDVYVFADPCSDIVFVISVDLQDMFFVDAPVTAQHTIGVVPLADKRKVYSILNSFGPMPHLAKERQQPPIP